MPQAVYNASRSVPRVRLFTRSLPAGGEDSYTPVMVGPKTLLPFISGSKPLKALLPVLECLEPDEYLTYTSNYYRQGLKSFGDAWQYADIVTVVYGVAGLMRPESYLEIGVRRGRSMAMVASQSPHCRIVGFDMWIRAYSGISNPGPEFVRQELVKVGFQGALELISGNSHETVKGYFQQNPDAYFDLITVDGDHSGRGAAQDLADVLPRLKIGGVIVFDDIAHPKHPPLRDVWRDMVENDPRFGTWLFDELGYGVAFGVRKW